MQNSSEFKIYEVVSYLKNPYYTLPEKTDIKTNIKYLIKSYLWCLLLILVITVGLSIFDKVIIAIFDKSIYSQIKNATINLKHSFGPFSIFVVAFIGPLIEEIVFRLPLNLTKFGFALASSIVTFRVLGNSFIKYDIQNKLANINNIISIVVLLITYFYLPSRWLEFLKGNAFKFFFYSAAIIFGFVHIFNVKDIDFSMIFFYPFFVIPQLIIGLFVGNIRMQKGFIWGFFLHSLINLISFIFS